MTWQTNHLARAARFPEDVRNAHRHSIRHRAEILASDTCGCFCCMAIYPSAEIVDWTDQDAGTSQTALCPRCGIDSVIGDRSGFPVTVDVLAEMHRHWF